jgi:ABC-type phosphate transport system substrate-binding protein
VRRSSAILLVLLATLSGVVQECHAELVVIVSAKSQVKALSLDQVTDLFLGNTASFPNGAHAIVLDQSEGSPQRDTFYQRTSGKAPAQMKAYWARMLFTGRAQPPVEAGDSAAIKRMVGDNPELVGYIDRGALDPSVRAVLTIR